MANPWPLSRELMARRAADRWLAAYKTRRGGVWYDERKKVIWEGLVSLGKDPSPDDVDRIIGNGSWTTTQCDGCRDEKGPWVQVGQEPDRESSTATLCMGCLDGAKAELQEFARMNKP